MLRRVREKDRDRWFKIIEDWIQGTSVIVLKKLLLLECGPSKFDLMEYEDIIQSSNTHTVMLMI